MKIFNGRVILGHWFSMQPSQLSIVCTSILLTNLFALIMFAKLYKNLPALQKMNNDESLPDSNSFLFEYFGSITSKIRSPNINS